MVVTFPVPTVVAVVVVTAAVVVLAALHPGILAVSVLIIMADVQASEIGKVVAAASWQFALGSQVSINMQKVVHK